MKILASILVVVIISITNIITAQNKTITATVLNISSDKGIVKFALYNKTNFRLKPLQSEIGNIENGKTTITFKEVAGGEYAIVCYHDKNSNDKMDFQPNGMPLEAYGASNNVMNFGPPKFDDAKFTVVDKNVSLEIKF
ncbi:DUF2141 domain-containing protein [Polaribacter sp.]|jgi:uncharacterized protein (DUF2141 family)|nr:DUF2141 domain-containing protein [Polaribacter sp.]MDB4204520.1 DUF2141 domain-containing protein [Polaribacter sp.]MDC1236961.1 DUF2141 domain-containing protein [Polaribacter sp.]|tara:strand:+ start:135 stop:548 length:414 start_codon:yes stop_codon:yes gene_type:complete